MNTLIVSLLLGAQSPEQILPAPNPNLPAPLPAPTPTPILVTKVPTLDEFAAKFVPFPGLHEAVILHPTTKKPVNVAFRLPNLPLREVHRCCNRLSFDYGRVEVTLIFRILSGKVDVRYDD